MPRYGGIHSGMKCRTCRKQLTHSHTYAAHLQAHPGSPQAGHKAGCRHARGQPGGRGGSNSTCRQLPGPALQRRSRQRRRKLTTAMELWRTSSSRRRCRSARTQPSTPQRESAVHSLSTYHERGWGDRAAAIHVQIIRPTCSIAGWMRCTSPAAGRCALCTCPRGRQRSFGSPTWGSSPPASCRWFWRKDLHVLAEWT